MSNDVAQRQYKAPPGTPSSIGPQIRTDFYQKQALIEAKKMQYFMQQADVTAMPKNFGKTIKRFHYLPLLDDRNVNDQGIDAAGNTRPADSFWEVKNSTTVLGHLSENAAGDKYTDGAAAIARWNELYPYGVNHDGVLADGADNTVTGAGNLYGSSKDVGVISAKLPALSETGGRVNRVGFRRVELEGTLEKFGFFDEYTQESLDFDTDSELMMHINREMVNGAHEMTEDALQIDLLNSPGVVRYPGAATSMATISGESGAETKLTYEDLMRVSIELDNNRTPKNTKIITGSRMIDTRVIDSARYLYIGSELIPTMKKMTDLFGNQAFIPVQQYADAGNVANGEIGSIDQFRIVVVPEMQHWSGVGGAVTSNGGYRSTSGKYDVYPMLVVGDGSFTTIGFQTNGKTVKFKIVHKKPGEATADWHDPYGETGFMSIKWYYGFMVLRPERIALMLSLAEI